VTPPRVAIVPGSFDPMTNGHLDLVARAIALFDHVIVGVLVNPAKASMLSLDDRVAACSAAVAAWPQVRVERFTGLLVDFAATHAAVAVVRGLRTGSDFEYEWPMARMNREMRPQIDTVFLAASPAWAHVSASLVRDIHRLGGDVGGFVPAAVLPFLPPATSDTR
jgi:pantetheine-phosphate adenylyltransferase